MIFTKENIEKYLFELSEQLKKKNVSGEILIFGGAAMILTFNSRPSTKDIDAIFRPKKEFQESIEKVALANDLEKNWLNDAVQGFLISDKFNQQQIFDFDNLKVFIPEPTYLLAMKVISMRTEAYSSDIEDIKTLIKNLNINSSKKIFDIVKEYYPEKMIPQRSYYAMEEILEKVFEKK